MTREEIENIPKNVNKLLDSSVTMRTRQKLNEKLNKVCKLAIKGLEQEPDTELLDEIRKCTTRKLMQKMKSKGKIGK